MQSSIDWSAVLAIIAINVTLFTIIAGFIMWAFSKLDNDIRALSAKLDADMKAQTSRTDQLYQMFIDLLKSNIAKNDH